MSSETQPITPARFAEALKELPSSSLALKVLELRNSIAHLDYSNAELKPFAEGTASAINNNDTNSQQPQPQPDQDCIDAIAENEAVIRSMQERIALIRTEAESRGLDWREFQGKEDDDDAEVEVEVVDASNNNGAAGAGAGARSGDEPNSTPVVNANLTNGVNGHAASSGGGNGQTQQQHEAWRDGTFQTGTIRGMSDEELLRQLTERMPLEDNDDDDDDDAEGGIHL